MILKRLILVLLAAFLVMGCVGAVSAETELNSSSSTIVITGIEPPITGGTPDTTAVTTATGISISKVSWDLAGASVFAGETVYTATITVNADTDYVFNTTALPSITINGGTVGTSNIQASVSTLTITKIFNETKLEQTPIRSINISGITAPIANTQPVTTKPTITNSNPSNSVTDRSEITWKTESEAAVSGNFTYDTTYSAVFTISAATNYLLTDSTDVAINGEKPTIIPYEDGTGATITVTFPRTELAPVTTVNITSLSITGLTPPEFGETPDKNFSVSGGGTPVNVSWYPSVSSKFLENTLYNATITIKNASGYIFNSTKPTVTLNGDTIDPYYVSVDLTSQLLTFTHTFDKTESKVLPTITLSANVTSGTIPLPVKFTYKITNESSATWTDGDASSASLSSMSGTLNHTYTTPGTYIANLTATNANGTVYKNITITVKKTQLVAGFQASALSGTAPLTVKFTDSSVGKITSRSWNFGDGTSDTIQNPTHTFTSPGKYIVILTISDGVDSDHAERTITVNPPVTITPTQTADVKSLMTTSGGTDNISEIPHPFNIIKEFIHLFYSLFDPASYQFQFAANES